MKYSITIAALMLATSTSAYAQVTCGTGTATGGYSTACGQGANTADYSGTVYGANATSLGVDGTAFGSSAKAAKTAFAAGTNAKSLGERSISIGADSQSLAFGSTAVGVDSKAWATNSTVLGYFASAVQNNGTALGYMAEDQAQNSVALGSNSLATEPNTISVGAPGDDRKIVNVAPGDIAAGSTDAVNGGQLYSLLNSAQSPLFAAEKTTLVQSQGITNAELQAGMAKMLSEANTRADSGTAAALAIGGIPTMGDGRVTVGGGFGTWRGSSGFAVGGSMMVGSHVALKAGYTMDTHGGNGFSAGAGWTF